MTVLLTGFLTCMALIVAIGPQSAWLLRQGLRRDRIMLAIGCCVAGDILLIGLGTAGVGAVLDHAPWLLDVVRWLGVAYVLWFAVHAFRSALRPTATIAQPADEVLANEIPTVQLAPPIGTKVVAARAPSSAARVATAGLAVSIANPHAWVDTLVVLGAMANSFGGERWLFAAGAVAASLCWHFVLGLGGRTLAPWLNRPGTTKAIDATVGVTMLVVATVLAFGA